MQYCSQPQDSPFDMKTVPIEAAPIGLAKCEAHLVRVLTAGFYPIVCTLTSAAMGEATPGASVQKSGAMAASKQDVYAS